MEGRIVSAVTLVSAVKILVTLVIVISVIAAAIKVKIHTAGVVSASGRAFSVFMLICGHEAFWHHLLCIPLCIVFKSLKSVDFIPFNRP